MSHEITWEPRAVAAASHFIEDDKDGLIQVLAAADMLAADPRPEGSFAYGSPDVRRIHVGRYRLLYEIDDQTEKLHVIHLGRIE